MFLTLLLSLVAVCSVAQAAGENDFQTASAMSVTAPYWGVTNLETNTSSTLADREANSAEIPGVLVPGHFVQTYLADGDRDFCQGKTTSILIILRKKPKEAN